MAAAAGQIERRGKRTGNIESLYGPPPFHFNCRCTTVSRMDDSQGPGSDGIIKIGETVGLESEGLALDQAESLKAWSVYTSPELANKINRALYATMRGERSAQKHADRHREVGAGSAEDYVRRAREVIANPDDILVFMHKARKTPKIAFGRRGNGLTDWLIAVVDSDVGRIMTLYGLDAKEPQTYEQRIARGKARTGWLEVKVSRERDSAE